MSAGIEEIVMRCLEKSPDQRYQSMAELKDALDRVFPADNEALFRTLPPGKMVVDKASAQPTKELKRDPESVIATKRLRRDIDVAASAAQPQSAEGPAKAMSSKMQNQGKKDGKSTTLMAGVIGGLIAACAVVAVSLINNQQSAAPPAAPPVVAPVVQDAPVAPLIAPSKPPVQATEAKTVHDVKENSPIPPTNVSTKPVINLKTAHKPVHKAAHVKPHQGSSTGSAPRPPREQPNDAEIWNEHVQKY